ncbi:hypothetical protein ABIB57_001453 [Devosia sp. UYZn731]|uniref:hypothetical protein n=1 Tax=Devosia sp. UYZn731 TaxID=3156345 RepID=UPI0033930F42
MRTHAAAPQPSSLGFNLAGIAVLVLLLAVGAAYVVDILGKNNRTAPPNLADKSTIAIAVAGKELTIPSSWFRYGEQLRGGFVNQIDLHVLLGQTAIPVDVTLLPRSRVRPSATLLDGVYLHQFDDATLSGVPGLVGKPLHDGDGFTGESVWYDALSANPFVAKCLAPVRETEPVQCLRTVFLPSGIAAVYAFDASALQSWRQFDSEMQKWLGQIGAW